MKKSKIFILFLVFVFFITTGQGCLKGVPQSVEQKSQPFTLEMWGVWDDSDAYSELIAQYKAAHPYISINYKKFRYEEYEQQLLEAFARGKGPDIFAIHNTWTKKYQELITPMPAQTSTVLIYESGSIKKETVRQIQTTRSITPREIRTQFVDQVAKDMVISGIDSQGNFVEQIYGLPLSVDTLAMFYNKSLLNLAGIPTPATTWKDFQQQVKQTTTLDKEGNVIQAGATIGTGSNVTRSFDILSLLMMQNGTTMMQYPTITFDKVLAGQSRTAPPGQEALRFYLDFSSSATEVYCWNEEMPNSIDFFGQGNAAFFFGYSYHTQQLKTDYPKLSFLVTKAPQIEGNPEINYANYWAFTVSNKSAHSEEAWNFIQYMTVNKDNVKKYLNKTQKPTALRELIEEQKENESILPFADQLLTAQSWYQGKNPNAAESVFIEMIDKAATGQYEIKDLIGETAKKVQQTIN